MNDLVTFLFPPNWSACVSGPHLALPLLAGVAREAGCDVLVWDLSDCFYRQEAYSPSRKAVVEAASRLDFEELDRLYFDWEDQLSVLTPDTGAFGLLSGFGFPELSQRSLQDVSSIICECGVVYDAFYRRTVIPRLAELNPMIIGITLASRNQVIPTIRLLQLIREALPKAFIVLGGNILTRLRELPAIKIFQSLVNQIVIFQGDMAFRRTIAAVKADRENIGQLLRVLDGDERVPFDHWCIPSFDGIDFEAMVANPVLPYVSTRGCYWGRCNFCAIPAGWATSGYAGTAPAVYVVGQLRRMVEDTGVRSVKFVDEALAPAKIRKLSNLLSGSAEPIEWEAYARLEKDWEDPGFAEIAYGGGLRKIYLGLEQAPTTNRKILNKNDCGNIDAILMACGRANIKVHLFCMVGYPGTTVDDARATTDFLIENSLLVDTADLVGFRLDRGTLVPGVRPIPDATCDWETSYRYEVASLDVLRPEEVFELEERCQEEIWRAAPQLLHPLFRLVGPWTQRECAGAENRPRTSRSEYPTLHTVHPT